MYEDEDLNVPSSLNISFFPLLLLMVVVLALGVVVGGLFVLFVCFSIT